jgi:hypothetical protein
LNELRRGRETTVRARRSLNCGGRPLKLTVSGQAVAGISVRQFRIVCIIALTTLLLTLLPSFGLITFSDGVRTARKWLHFEAALTGWPLWIYALVNWLLTLIGVIGMLNFWRSARWCLVAVLLGAVVMRPFLGLSVYSAYEAVLGTILGSCCIWLITVSFWSPIADHFTND